MGYLLPSNTDWVSCTWQCHLDRTPPSGEAGTDYGAAYGTPIWAVDPGTVTYVQTHNGYPTGRHVEYRLDDGRTTRSLHMSEIWVKVGDRVARGQQIGKVGGSGYGDDWYYGPHVHQTLFPGVAWAAPTINFELYVGDATPPPNPNPPSGKEDKVIFYRREDATARKKGRTVAPGQAFWLNTTLDAPAKNATNIVGKVGTYSFTTHVYVEGRPGDIVTMILYWDQTKTDGPHSPHYSQDVVIPDTGVMRHQSEFKRGVASGEAVYLRLIAGADNQANVKVTVLDTDAFMFVSA